jgi:hypothetical protein
MMVAYRVPTSTDPGLLRRAPLGIHSHLFADCHASLLHLNEVLAIQGKEHFMR